MRLLSTFILITITLQTTSARHRRPRPNPVLGALQNILSPANAERTMKMVKMATKRTLEDTIAPIATPSPANPMQYSPPILPLPENLCHLSRGNQIPNMIVPNQVSPANSVSHPANPPTPVSIPYQMLSPTPYQMPSPTPYQMPSPTPYQMPSPTPYQMPSPTPYQMPNPMPVQIPSPMPVQLPSSVPIQVPNPVPLQNPNPTQIQIPYSLPLQVPNPVPQQFPNPMPVQPVATPSPTPSAPITQALRQPEFVLENTNLPCPCQREILYPAAESPPSCNYEPLVSEVIALTPAQDTFVCPIPSPATLFNPFLPAASPVSSWTQENLPTTSLGTRSQYLRKIPIPPPTL